MTNMPFNDIKLIKKLFKEIVKKDTYRIRNFCPRSINFIIDIGANIGIFSIFARFLQPDAKIFAIEPYEKTYQQLKNNIKAMNIFVLNFCLGNGDNFVPININTNITQITYLDRQSIKGEKGGVLSMVASKKLSTIFHDINIPRNSKYFIKIDCEGGEKFLLNDKDAENIIRNSVQTSIEVHFKSKSKPFDYFLDWNIYNDWIHAFSSTHTILYHHSNKRRGVGVYILSIKT